MLRRSLLKSALSLGVLSLGSSVGLSKDSQTKDIQKGPGGLYTQSWFHNSFLDLKEDFEEAKEKKKLFAILWEQEGCPYCHELHKVNLSRPAIANFMKEHFLLLQLDIKGSRKVTDFDGNEIEERELAQLYGVNFTPSISFFPPQFDAIKEKKGRQREAFRLAGYWKPFHFETVLRFVKNGYYKKSTLANYLNKRLELMKRNGKKPRVWE